MTNTIRRITHLIAVSGFMAVILPLPAQGYTSLRFDGPTTGERAPIIELVEVADSFYGTTSYGNGDVSPYESLIQIHFPDEAGRTWARRVMACESGGNPDAENPVSTASGLFQFLDSTWAWASEGAGFRNADVYDASTHVAVAAWLYYNVGPSQWSCK